MVDDGTACEIGIFYALMQADPSKKGILGLLTDLRGTRGHEGHGLQPLRARLCRGRPARSAARWTRSSPRSSSGASSRRFGGPLPERRSCPDRRSLPFRRSPSSGGPASLARRSSCLRLSPLVRRSPPDRRSSRHRPIERPRPVRVKPSSSSPSASASRLHAYARQAEVLIAKPLEGVGIGVEPLDCGRQGISPLRRLEVASPARAPRGPRGSARGGDPRPRRRRREPGGAPRCALSRRAALPGPRRRRGRSGRRR